MYHFVRSLLKNTVGNEPVMGKFERLLLIYREVHQKYR